MRMRERVRKKQRELKRINGNAGELEGSPASFRIRTAPQRERSDRHETRRGVHPAYPRQTHPGFRNNVKWNRSVYVVYVSGVVCQILWRGVGELCRFCGVCLILWRGVCELCRCCGVCERYKCCVDCGVVCVSGVGAVVYVSGVSAV